MKFSWVIDVEFCIEIKSSWVSDYEKSEFGMSYGTRRYDRNNPTGKHVGRVLPLPEDVLDSRPEPECLLEFDTEC